MADLAHLLGAALIGLALAQPGGEVATGALRFELEVRTSYPVGQPVEIKFTLENRSSEPLHVLTWYTPLEGIKGEIFQVTRGGRPVPYQGRLVKRGTPPAKDYLRIEPHRSRSATVDLAGAWDLSRPGDYRVRFVGRIHDVVRDAAALPRPQNEHRGLDVQGNTVRFSVR